MEPVIGSIPTAAVWLREGRIEAANGAASDLFAPELDVVDLLDLLLDDDRAALLDAAERPPASVEVRTAAGPPRRFFRVDLGPHPDGGAVAVLIETTERRRLEAVAQDVATGLYTTDAELRGRWMPERMAETIGVDRGLFEGLDVYSLVHPDDVRIARAIVARATGMPGVAFSTSARILHPSHPGVYYRALVHVRWLPDDDALGGLLVRFDTGVMDSSTEVVTPELGIVSFRDATPLGFLNVAITGELVQSSFRARAILRPVLATEVGSDWLDRVRPEDRLTVDDLLATARMGEPPPPVEVGFVGNGERVWTRMEMLPYLSRTGEVGGTFVNLLDITAEYETRTELARAREQLWAQSRTDALTGLSNRVPFVDALTAAVGTNAMTDPAARDGERGPAVLVCDLDGFKAINDTFGHRVGDEVLVEIGRRLSRAVRADDVLCRYGGDEFLVLCHSVAPDELEALAARIVDVVQDELVLGGVIHRVGVSVGVAMVRPGDEDDPDELVRRADQAMYRAKSGGGHRAVSA